MAQINLLKQTASRQPMSASFFKLLPIIFGLVLLGVIGYYGWLVFSAKSISGKLADLDGKISTESSAAINNPRRGELLTRELQLIDLNSLVAGHLYWSQIFPVLAEDTLKTASYETVTIVPQTNTITLTAQVPTLEDLNKFMQVFNLSKVNQSFSNVRIGGFTQVQGTTGSEVKFTVNMTYDPSIVQYHGSGPN